MTRKSCKLQPLELKCNWLPKVEPLTPTPPPLPPPPPVEDKVIKRKRRFVGVAPRKPLLLKSLSPNKLPVIPAVLEIKQGMWVKTIQENLTRELGKYSLNLTSGGMSYQDSEDRIEIFKKICLDAIVACSTVYSPLLKLLSDEYDRHFKITKSLVLKKDKLNTELLHKNGELSSTIDNLQRESELLDSKSLRKQRHSSTEWKLNEAMQELKKLKNEQTLSEPQQFEASTHLSMLYDNDVLKEEIESLKKLHEEATLSLELIRMRDNQIKKRRRALAPLVERGGKQIDIKGILMQNTVPSVVESANAETQTGFYTPETSPLSVKPEMPRLTFTFGDEQIT